MLKRIKDYQKFYCKTFHNNWGSAGSVIAFVTLLLVTILVGSVGVIEINYVEFAVLCSFVGLVSQFYDNMHAPMLRQVPVSDRFATFNLLVVTPLYFFVVIIVAFLIVCTLFSTILMIAVEGATVREIIGTYGALGTSNFWKDWAIRLLVLLVKWPIFMLMAFYGEFRKQMGILAGYVISLLAAHWWLVEILRGDQYYAKYTYSEVIQLLPYGGWILVSMVVLAVILWAFAWKKCLWLYRTDIIGQKRKKEKKGVDVCGAQKGNPVALAIVLFILGATMIGITVATIFGVGGQECNITIDNPQHYQELSFYADREGIDSEVYFLDSNQSIFPERIDGVKVEQYHASIKGNCGDGWSSLSWERLLVATYSKEDYLEEKNRVSMLSYTNGTQTNNVIKDTQHFSCEAYIAIYDENWQLYEYALFDDTNCRVAYVFLQDTPSFTEVEVDFDVALKKDATDIIPLQKANTDGKGFSIYSFWDDKEEYYTIWWPGKKD